VELGEIYGIRDSIVNTLQANASGRTGRRLVCPAFPAASTWEDVESNRQFILPAHRATPRSGHALLKEGDFGAELQVEDIPQDGFCLQKTCRYTSSHLPFVCRIIFFLQCRSLRFNFEHLDR
jgi:hypothetical protein